MPQLLEYLSQNHITVKKLQRMVFGVSSEKTARVWPKDPPNPSDPAAQSNPKEPKKRPGHGRKGAKDYPGARQVPVLNGWTLTPPIIINAPCVL